MLTTSTWASVVIDARASHQPDPTPTGTWDHVDLDNARKQLGLPEPGTDDQQPSRTLRRGPAPLPVPDDW